MARWPRRGTSPPINPIAAAYFRDLNEAIESTNDPEPLPDRAAAVTGADIAASLDAVAELMAEAGVAPAQPRALLGPAGANTTSLTPLEPFR